MRRLLRDRNSRWYLSGQAFSLLGDSSLWLALAIWVKELTGSAGAAGLTFFFFALSGLVSPFAGMVVDRVRRRRLLFVVNLASAGLVLALFGVHSRGQVWLIYLVMFLYGVSYAFLASGQSALLKAMLPEDLLGDANGVIQTEREALRLVAPLVGAGLFAVVGGHVIAVIDAVTFVIAAASLLGVKVDETTARQAPAAAGLEAEAEHWWAEITAGIRHVWRTTVLRQVVLGTGIALLVVGFFESLSFAIVASGLHKPPTFLGVLLSVQGVGAVGGGLSAAPLMRRVSAGLLVGVGVLVMAVSSVLVMPPSLPVVFVGVALLGLSIPWIVVGFYTLLQVLTPNHLQGRVYSAADTVLSMPQTVSIGVGAALVGVVEYRILLGIIAVVLALSGLYLLTRRELRQHPRGAGPIVAAGLTPAPEAGRLGPNDAGEVA